MKQLEKTVKIFIIQRLAMRETPSEAALSVKENFGLEIKRNRVAWYNAELNPKLPEKWKRLFEETRRSFQNEVFNIAIANKVYRLRELQRLFERAKNSKSQNPVLIRDILKSAAKESGNYFQQR